MALSKGDINLEDAIDIREIKNILSLPINCFKLKRNRKKKSKSRDVAKASYGQLERQLKSQQMARR